MNVAGIAPHGGRVGDGEVVVGPQRDGALERRLCLAAAAECAQCVAEVVETPRILRVQRDDAGERIRRALRFAALAAQDAELLMRGDERRLQRDRPFEVLDRCHGAAGALLELSGCVMRECVVRIEAQRGFDVCARR